IIGYGNTGQAFAKRMSGFEAKVLAYDKYRKDYGDAFAQQATQEQIWAEADIVSFHIFYEEANHFLVDEAYLSRFAKPVYLVNTARGLILNTADLVAAMQQGRVLGAALDVIEYEEMSFSSVKIDDLPEPFQYLRQAKNAVLAPHIAGWSHEAKVKHAEVLLGKILNSFPKKN
ncbi:MAG: hydroxyacid dehydrogenase, partial [Saprospiraceae bacterium]|nr:hydroxyacid dehydrogenase [Saprospiraceae bacterium]